jgi:transporter family-2 protein
MPANLALFAAFAFFGGMLVAAQGPIYARLAEGLGRNYLLAVFLAFTTAALVTGLMALASGNFRGLTVGMLTGLPRWVWLGGMFGAIHVVISMQSIPALGASLFVVIVVTGNLFGAALYDHLGVMGLAERPFSAAKALGLVLVILGVGLVARA